MDITFNCDKCGQEIIIEESGAGLHVECPKCTASIIVPSPNIRISEKRLRLKPRVEDNSSRLNPNLNDILPQTQAAAKSFKTLPKFLTVLVIIVIGYCSVKYFADKSPQNLSKTDSSLRSVERPHQETFDFYGSEQDAKADMLYAEFENAVHSKDIDKAIAFQRSVTGVFTNKTQTEQFWCKKIPLYAQRTLVLAYACPDCNDGICGECTGKKICKKCDGNKQCVQCLGNGALTEKCIRCICSLCKGNRACKACNGRKFFKCPTCNGDSQVVGEPTHSPCVRCSGTGRLKSGFKDSNTTLPCVACASKGYFEMTSMVQCSTCRGSGAVNCQNCNGTGRCSSCQGNGRFARCSLCFSTGVIRRECRSCSGNGVCATCKGAGMCPKCEGNGKCHTCQGTGLARSGTLLVNVGWIKQDTGYVVYNNSKLIPSLAIGDQSTQSFGKSLSFSIATHELWCISGTNDFTFVKSEVLR